MHDQPMKSAAHLGISLYMEEALADLLAALRLSERGLIDVAAKLADTRLVRLCYHLAGLHECLRREVGALEEHAFQRAQNGVSRRYSRNLERLMNSVSANWQEAAYDGDVYRLLCELERSERALIEHYEKLFELRPSTSAQQILSAHRRNLTDALRRIRQLREESNPYARWSDALAYDNSMVASRRQEGA